jgi:hypothetical protein
MRSQRVQMSMVSPSSLPRSKRPLGIGSVAVAISTDMFVLMTDRIVLAISEAEISQRLAGADRRR